MANLPLAGQTDTFARASNLFGDSFADRINRAKAAGIDVSKIDPTIGFLAASVDPGNQYQLMQAYLGEEEKRKQREAEYRQKLGKESLAETAKYQMLFNIPQTISQSFGNIAAMQALGARNATEALATTLASYPRTGFNILTAQPQSYFS